MELLLIAILAAGILLSRQVIRAKRKWEASKFRGIPGGIVRG